MVMGVWEVLNAQETLKLLMRVMHEHDKTSKRGKILREKQVSISYSSSK